MIVAAVVHATGINWEGIAPILAGIAGVGGIIVTMQTRRDNKQAATTAIREREQERRNNEIKDQIANSVNSLSDLLLAKLETKDTVSRISERLARVETYVEHNNK